MAEPFNVLCSGAFIEALRALVPLIETGIGCRLAVVQGASFGASPGTIPARLRRAEPCDLAIVFDETMDALVAEGLVTQASRRKVATSRIAMAVPAGRSLPDIGTQDALTRALCDAKSIALSSSASGSHVQSTLLPRLGIAQAVRGKCIRVEGERVASVLARGGADIGFQQLSEFMGAEGIAIAGELPPALQQVQVLAAGIPTHSGSSHAAASVIDLLGGRDATEVILRAGLRPT